MASGLDNIKEVNQIIKCIGQYTEKSMTGFTEIPKVE